MLWGSRTSASLCVLCVDSLSACAVVSLPDFVVQHVGGGSDDAERLPGASLMWPNKYIEVSQAHAMPCSARWLMTRTTSCRKRRHHPDMLAC